MWLGKGGEQVRKDRAAGLDKTSQRLTKEKPYGESATQRGTGGTQPELTDKTETVVNDWPWTPSPCSRLARAGNVSARPKSGRLDWPTMECIRQVVRRSPAGPGSAFGWTLWARVAQKRGRGLRVEARPGSSPGFARGTDKTNRQTNRLEAVHSPTHTHTSGQLGTGKLGNYGSIQTLLLLLLLPTAPAPIQDSIFHTPRTRTSARPGGSPTGWRQKKQTRQREKSGIEA